jgi:MFS family permease
MTLARPESLSRLRLERKWLVVAGAFLVQFILIGTTLYSFGLFVKPLSAEFHASRTAISSVFILYSVVGAVLGPLVGGIVAQNPIRPVMYCGAAFVVAGFLVLSFARSLVDVYLAYGLLVGVGNILLGVLPCSALIVRWFDEDRGLALGLSQFGASLGGPVFSALGAFTMLHSGWRWAACVFSLVGALVLPILTFLVSDRPPPDGSPPRQGVLAAGRELLATLAARILSGRLWLAVLFVGFATTPAIAVIQLVHSDLTDRGLSVGDAGGLLALMTFLGAISKPAFGRLADKYPLRSVILVAMGLQVIALIALAIVHDHRLLIAAIALFGVGYGGLAPLTSLVIATLFGSVDFPRVTGLMALLLLPFGVAGLPFASWIDDRTGAYTLAYLGFAAFLAVAATTLFRLKLRAAR